VDHPSQLLIALEPEAASIYVRKLRLYQLVPEPPYISQPRREPTPDLSLTLDRLPEDDEFLPGTLPAISSRTYLAEILAAVTQSM